MQNLLLIFSYYEIISAFAVIGGIMKIVEKMLNYWYFWKKSNLELESMKLDNKKKRLEIKKYKKKLT